MSRKDMSGAPPPLEVGEAMIVGMGVTVHHRFPHVQKGHGPPATRPYGQLAGELKGYSALWKHKTRN